MRPPESAAAMILKHYSVALLVTFLISCRGQGGTFVGSADASGVTSCASTEDCAGLGVCRSGVCEAVTTCVSDGDCSAEGKVCHTQRGYCVECNGRRPNECGPGRTCQFDFTCVPVSAPSPDERSACTGSCVDGSGCGPEQICKAGSCCSPPSRCGSSADCPSARPECNGATGQCFGSSGCFSDAECASAPGCSNDACRCAFAVSPPGDCRARPNECASDADCRTQGAYMGKACALETMPARCVDAPRCASDAECSELGLVCDRTNGSESQGRCINGRACPSGRECDASTQVCNPRTHVCQPRSCLNTPGVCAADEICDPMTAECRSSQGGRCARDAECPADRYCDVGSATCSIGCRSGQDCASGVCNAMHQCESAPGAVCGRCTSDADCPSGTRCVEGVGFCYETCSTILNRHCTINPSAQCILGNCTCIF